MQETIPKDERTYKWKIATGVSDDEVPLTMSTPVLSRWWWVNQAIGHLLKDWDGWGQLAESIKNSSKSNSLPHRLACILVSLMGGAKVKS